jgi:hypothetical protein
MTEPWNAEDAKHYKALMLKEFKLHKKNGTSKNGCFVKIKMAELMCEKRNFPSEYIQGMAATAMEALEEVFAKDGDLTKKAALQALYDHARKKIEDRKLRLGLTKEQAQLEITSSYIEVIAEGEDKEGSHETMEIMLKMVDEVYAE